MQWLKLQMFNKYMSNNYIFDVDPESSFLCCVLPAFILIIYKGYKQGSEGGKR